MATETKDSSVVMALSELVQLESARIENDRVREEERIAAVSAERERVASAAREAERVRGERAAQDARVAEAEARLRLEADRDRDQRIASMRLELARVEAERLAMRADLESRVLGRTEPSRPSGWALAFGLSSLVAASLAAVLAVQQSTRTATLPVDAAPTHVAIAPTPVATPEIAPAIAPAPVEIAMPEQPLPLRHPRHPRQDRTQLQTATHATALVGLDPEDGDEPVSDAFLHQAEAHGARR